MQIKNFNIRLDLVLVLVGLLYSLLMIKIPITFLILGILLMAVFVYFAIKPEHCYYALVFTIPFTERIRALPISFSINDILILLCTLVVLVNILTKDERVSLRTKIDWWILALVILYFAAGLYSVNDRALLSSFKFLESILAFYLTVYFVRTKRVRIKSIIKVLIATAFVQAFIGIFQSFTGIGANFMSSRNVLGYLGIGSRWVWHGMGTLGHFNMLGNFLVNMTLFYLPIYFWIIKNKKLGGAILLILLIGIYTTYSRGSMMGLYFGGLLFLSQILKDKVKFYIGASASMIILFILYKFLSDTSYTTTLSDRTQIWEVVMAAVTSKFQYIVIGGGLNSYADIVWRFIPPNALLSTGNWYAHNFYLVCLQSMGIVGLILNFSFLIYLQISTIRNTHRSNNMLKALNLSVAGLIFSIFFISIVDHAYSLTFFKIMLFIMLGMIYARNTNSFHNPKTA